MRHVVEKDEEKIKRIYVLPVSRRNVHERRHLRVCT